MVWGVESKIEQAILQSVSPQLPTLIFRRKVKKIIILKLEI